MQVCAELPRKREIAPQILKSNSIWLVEERGRIIICFVVVNEDIGLCVFLLNKILLLWCGLDICNGDLMHISPC